MKTKKISPVLFLLLSCVCLYSYAQKERNVWCFGMNVELDFNSGQPVELQGSFMNTLEGCSSISDKNTGQLLFYTNGMQVFDRSNNLMPGDSIHLGGDISSTQSAMIVPVPGSGTQYYVFCTAYQAMGEDSGAQYTIIDMNMHGGLGDIAQQPRRLLTPTCEKIAVAWMPGNQGYWLVFHQWKTDAFYAYPVTTSGIGAPVVSHAGLVHSDVSGDNFATLGYMRISPDGKKIAVAVDCILTTLQVFNFNSTTGAISDLLLTDNSLRNNTANSFALGPYGVCFSPDSKLLYVTAEFDSNLYQYNLQAGDNNAVLASRTVVAHTTDGYLPYAMQYGPIGSKIYVALYNYSYNYSQYIASIDSPNLQGTQCHFTQSAIYLQDGLCQIGLPEFPPMLPVNCQVAPVTISSDKNIICPADSTPVCAPSGYSSYQWNATGTDSCIQVKNAGNYYVTVTDNNGCTAESNHLTISVHSPPSVSVSVHGDTLTSFNAVSYQWYLNNEPIPNSTGPVLIAGQQGSYSLAITDSNGCAAVSSPIIVTGITDIQSEQFSIYPNPNSTGSWQLETTNGLIGSQIEIMDDEGRLVFKSEIRNTKQDISFTAARGVYLLRVSSSDNSIIKKLVKL